MSDTLEESFPAHAPLGPSSAEGWSTCAGYVHANRGLPDTSGKAATEGTIAHEISDMCLSLGLDASDFLGMVTVANGYIFAWEEDDAMLLQRGIDQVRAMVGTAEFFGERRVSTAAWTLPDQFGTLDRAWLTQDDATGEWWITVNDLKFGRGIAVSPVNNKQIMLYALAFWYDIARHLLPAGVKPRFRLMIDQPRHGGGGGVWETTFDAIMAFAEWIGERAKLTVPEDAPRTASLAGCRWCRRKSAFPAGLYGGCATYDTYMLGLLGLSATEIDIALMMGMDMTLPIDMTPERASYILTHKDAIERWLTDMHERVLADALTGAPTGQVKAVEGNKTADIWHGKGVPVTPVVQHHLGDKGFTKRLKSVKQVLKAADGDEAAITALTEHIRYGRKKPVLVSIADARPALISAQSQFDEEAESDADA